MMSTLMGVRLGHVMNGLMVNVVANNFKLYERAENIVMDITGCDRKTAKDNLKISNGAVEGCYTDCLGSHGFEQRPKNTWMIADQNLRSAISSITSG